MHVLLRGKARFEVFLPLLRLQMLNFCDTDNNTLNLTTFLVFHFAGYWVDEDRVFCFENLGRNIMPIFVNTTRVSTIHCLKQYTATKECKQ